MSDICHVCAATLFSEDSGITCPHCDTSFCSNCIIPDREGRCQHCVGYDPGFITDEGHSLWGSDRLNVDTSRRSDPARSNSLMDSSFDRRFANDRSIKLTERIHTKDDTTTAEFDIENIPSVPPVVVKPAVAAVTPRRKKDRTEEEEKEWSDSVGWRIEYIKKQREQKFGVKGINMKEVRKEELRTRQNAENDTTQNLNENDNNDLADLDDGFGAIDETEENYVDGTSNTVKSESEDSINVSSTSGMRKRNAGLKLSNRKIGVNGSESSSESSDDEDEMDKYMPKNDNKKRKILESNKKDWLEDFADKYCMVPFVILSVVFSILSFLVLVYFIFDEDLLFGLYMIGYWIVRLIVVFVFAFLATTLGAYLIETYGGPVIPASSLHFIYTMSLIGMIAWWYSLRLAVYPILGAVVAVGIINLLRLKPSRKSLTPTMLVLLGIVVILLIDRRLFWKYEISYEAPEISQAYNNRYINGGSESNLKFRRQHDWGYNDDELIN